MTTSLCGFSPSIKAHRRHCTISWILPEETSRLDLARQLGHMGVYEYPGVPTPVPPPPDFTLAVNPSSVTVLQGQSGTFSVTVTPAATATLGSGITDILRPASHRIV